MPKIRVKSSNHENIKIGQLRSRQSLRGDLVLGYSLDLRHTILDLHKEVKAQEIEILQNKVDALMASWDKKFEDHQKKAFLSASNERAEEMAIEEEEKRNNLRNILHYTLNVDDAVDWEVLKSYSIFEKGKFLESRPEEQKTFLKPDAPAPLKIGFLVRLLGLRKRVEANFEIKKSAYEHEKRETEEKNKKEYDAWCARMEAWRARMADWDEKVDALKESWLAGSEHAILEHANMVLDASNYSDMISKNFQLEYNAETKTMMVDYALPSPDDLPVIKTFRFVNKTEEMKTTEISAKDKKDLYDDICYQMCLRTIHELFEADLPGNLQAVLFNGSTDYIDKGTGQEVHSTILSILVNREEFLAINLTRIEPKICFKSLKGVSAATLVGLSPIAPIMKLNREDSRFVEARSVDLGDDGATNLAAMDWEEFEHLVREVFDKEFSLRGGEVQVTQSSSDGGVDAVAFDPDPISGGKIIIQAKRYTKTVGVAAVRDLYGTTMNEGAIKGILVTTADYGPDAHKFAQDKPLTLMTGNHLLHLLEKHGIRAKIDLKEARKELGLREKES